jgi:hypothetical protein
MKVTRFQTDRRLWFWIALALFIACWLIPFMDIKGWHASLFGVFLEIASDVFRGNMSFAEAIDNSLIPVTVFTFVFGVAAIVLAWVVQCIVVIIRNK